MYLALELVYVTLDKESHTRRADQALALAKQALDMAEQNNHYRLVRKYQQRENDLLELIPKMIGPQMIASYNWRGIIQENAAGKDRIEEQNAEIEDLNQEITCLRAQLPAPKNPRKWVSTSEAEKTRPVDDTYEFVYCDPGQIGNDVKDPSKKSRKG